MLNVDLQILAAATLLLGAPMAQLNNTKLYIMWWICLVICSANTFRQSITVLHNLSTACSPYLYEGDLKHLGRLRRQPGSLV